MENLCILLSDDAEESTATVANLPTNEDGMKVLSSPDAEDFKISANFEINQIYVTVWMSGKDEIVWYVGYITEINEDTYTIDHLERNPKGQVKYWVYPNRQDKHALTEEQILEVNEKGDWTFEPRNRKFILMNEKEISYHLKQKVN